MKERGHARTSEQTAVHAQTARQRGQSSHHGDARAARTAEHRLAKAFSGFDRAFGRQDRCFVDDIRITQ
jgi:hypothetical protein